jgi:hypothetical protein
MNTNIDGLKISVRGKLSQWSRTKVQTEQLIQIASEMMVM